MTDTNKTILVLGAGVSGLSSGILLLEAGFDVQLWAKEFSPNITSDVAAAVWFPYLAEPKEKVAGWAAFTIKYLKEHVVQQPNSGCRKQVMSQLFDHQVDDPAWKDDVDAFRRLQKHEIPAGYADGYAFDSVLMDPSIYLDWLQDQFTQLGGRIQQKAITNIDEALQLYDIVVNCTGLGSRQLFNDNQLFPVRGQVIKVKPNGFDGSVVDEDGHNGLSYMVARFNEVVLGGTAQPNNWNLQVDPKDSEDILRKVKELAPNIKTFEVIKTAVGLRPARSTVRLETQTINDKHVIHNYGHGGSGYTLSWGCAQNVVTLAKELQ